MIHCKSIIAIATATMALAICCRAAAQEAAAVTAVSSERTISQLLPDSVAGVKAIDQIRVFDVNSMADANVYKEYGAVGASSRRYGPSRIDLFRTQTSFGALGLFSYYAGLRDLTVAGKTAWLGDELVFWRSTYFGRVSGPRSTSTKLGAGIATLILPSETPAVLPTLVRAIPSEIEKPTSIRYILGAESLTDFVTRAGDVFQFEGGAEAVVGEYKQTGRGRHTTPLKLLVVEYHTPQFAREAIDRLAAFVGSLPSEDQARIVYRREGNFVVQATDVVDRKLADRLVNSVKYPYGVKWLSNPDLVGEDPLQGQKTAQVLVSTFSLIGLVGLIALLVGGLFGALVFMKRRKRLRAIFSDAGGMLRLDLDPLPGTALPGSKSRLLGSGDE